jgi:nucleoside-diphosphate-sugar epimerase
MKFLVLGSEGQIGYDLVKYIKYLNEPVTTFDIVECKAMDLRINGTVDDYIKNSDFVFFLAYDAGGANYLREHQSKFEFIDNNVRLMQNTFTSLKKYDKPFMFSSSQMSNMLYSSYGVLKSIGEYYTKSLNGMIVKFWNVYGIEHDPSKTHVVTDFVNSAIKNKYIKLQTDGEEERQFLYVRDCSNALHILANKFNDIPKNKEIHITSFEWSKIIDIANIVAEEIKNVNIEKSNVKDEIQKLKKNIPDPYIKTLWTPNYSLKSGISEIIKHTLENQ